MTRHPKPDVLARHLHAVANLLDHHGSRAIDMAALLAARGWPTATLGDGGSRSSDMTSSTERTALSDPGRYEDADRTLAKLLRLIWTSSLRIEGLVTDLVAHADDMDPLPAGTGECVACKRWCRPDGDHPHDRLRAGLCPACHQAWLRWRQTNQSDRHGFLTWRRHQLAQPAEEAS